jgi:hypothetical protein
MFNFLNSTFLIAAAAALIPLIIHLFSKRRVKVIEFSSLKHLKAMQRRQVRRLKIRQLLLLIIRMLIILAVVLAFARPTVREGGLGSHAAVSAVILFDNSASMNRYVADGDLFELARKRTEQLLTTFGEADQVALLPLDGTAGGDDAIDFASAATAAEMLTRLHPGSSTAELQSGLDKALELLDRSDNLNREIYLITDRQRRNLPQQPVLSESDARLYLVELPLEETGNCGITAIDFGGQLLMPGHDFDLTATVKNYGDADRDDLIASLSLNGNRVAQTDVRVAAGAEAAVRFTRSVSHTGFHSGWIELSDDRFAGDNRFCFSLHIPDRFNVLIIRGDNSSRFVSLALTPAPSVNQYWSVKQADPEQLSGVNFREYDVVILAGVGPLADTYVERLWSFVDRGKSLFVIYGGPTDTDEFNRQWSATTGVVIEEPIQQSFSKAGYYTFSSVDLEHPIFSVFGFEDGRPPQVKFYTLPRLHLEGDSRALMRFTGDRPALVERRYGRGRVLTFTGPMAPSYSDLTGHAFFVPFISRVAEYLASDLSTVDLDLYVGDNIARSVNIRGTLRSPLVLHTPDSSSFQVPPEEDGDRLLYRPEGADQPGVYRATYLGQEVDRFALNLSPREADLAVVDVDQMVAALGAEDFHRFNPEDNLMAALAELRFGKELWSLFLWIAAALLLCEMLLARGGTAEE